MKICLKKSAKQQNAERVSLKINERLPVFMHSPCKLECTFKVEEYQNYYVLSLEVNGDLFLTCQRCLDDFQYTYHNNTQVAVCRSEHDAEQLMSSYECIVSETNEIDLIEIITDELHLFCPEKHTDLTQCDLLIH